jgi:uncharacterized membrane protein
LQVLRQTQSAILIQLAVRTFLAKSRERRFQYERQAAIVLQSLFRRFVKRKQFTFTMYCAVVLQSCIRGFRTRKKIRAYDYAALVIQHAWWTHVAKNGMHSAASTIQNFWRFFSARQVLKERKKLSFAA